MATDRNDRPPHGAERPSWPSVLSAVAVRACVIFTVACAVALAVGTAAGAAGVAYGWSLLAASAAGAVLQAVFFTDVLIRGVPYPVRVLLFGVGFYGLLAWVAAACRWFPVDRPGAWVMFTAFYLGGLVAGCVAQTVRERAEERRLAEHLDRWKGGRL